MKNIIKFRENYRKEMLEEIPDGDVCVQIDGIKLEVMRSDDQAIRTVRIFRPGAKTGAKAGKGSRR